MKLERSLGLRDEVDGPPNDELANEALIETPVVWWAGWLRAAYAYAAALEGGGISVPPELLGAADRLRELGWLWRGWGEDGDVVFTPDRDRLRSAGASRARQPREPIGELKCWSKIARF
jgi:hypothetical protein